MLVTVEELGKTELYPEIINRIVRGDPRDAEQHILDAEDIAKGYMSKYDTDAIFGTEISDPTFPSRSIKKVVKAIAAWFLVKKANPNVNIELFHEDFVWAIDWLKDLQAGNINPSLPYKPDDPDTPEDESLGQVWWDSNVKRKQNFD